MGTKMGTEQIKNAAKPSKYGMFESSLYLRVPSRALRIQGNLNPFFVVFSGIPGLLDTVGTIDLGWEPVGTKIRLRRELNIMKI